MRAPVSAPPPVRRHVVPHGQPCIRHSGPTRAPVSGGDERRESGRKRNKAQLAEYSEKRQTINSRDVRGKTQGEIIRVKELRLRADGSVELSPNHFSDVQSKMAWFCTFL